MCRLQHVEALHFYLYSVCAHLGVVRPLRVDIISAMWLPGSIAYFICDIYERMQKMHVPGTQGMSEYSRGKGHHWKKKWNLPTLSF